MDDLISRLSEIRSQYNLFDESEEPYYRALSEAIKVLSGQADGDAISRKAAIDAVCAVCGNDCDKSEFVYNVPQDEQVILCPEHYVLCTLPPAQPEPQWIPCSERLPEEDVEVLISYRYKEGEGDTSHIDMDITTYGQMYFGGNKVGNRKHWRAPFEYFESNYEVVAWMPLPEPYRGE